MHTTDFFAGLPLDRAGDAALFRQLYGRIKSAILDGTLSPGMRLPPTRDLCGMLAVSRQTILNAYDQLMAEGYLSGTVGKGTFVSAHLPAGR